MAQSDTTQTPSDPEDVNLDLEAHVGEELVKNDGSYTLGVLRSVRSCLPRHSFETPRGQFISRSEENIRRVIASGAEWQEPAAVYGGDD